MSKSLKDLDKDQLLARIKNQVIQKWVVSGALLASLIYFVVMPLLLKLKNRNISVQMLPVDRTIADPTIEVYRENFAYQRLSFSSAKKVAFIAHTYGDFFAYRAFFDTFRSRHNTVAGYEWGVGIYPGVFYNNGSRLGIYLIPTMIKTGDPSTVLDYWKYQDSNYYLKRNDGSTETDDYIYDQGTVFP